MKTVNQFPFDANAVKEAGQIRAYRESQGLPIGPYDLLLAGQALASGIVLVSANVKEFGRVPGLKLENWQV